MSLATILLEKLVRLGFANPMHSINALDSYGWDRVGDKEYTHERIPGHKMHIASGFVRHVNHGMGTSISHDDFLKYLRDLHTQKSGYKDKDWIQPDEED